tara:strand:+ start:325 stop:729 length:405 start_codon:yes stop_codon:yes gene_type:complete
MVKSPVSYKISKLVREGVSHKQAVAIALNMNSKGRLGVKGGYKRSPRYRSPLKYKSPKYKSPKLKSPSMRNSSKLLKSPKHTSKDNRILRTRKGGAPRESATLYKLGTKLLGTDGSMYKVIRLASSRKWSKLAN